MSFEQYVLYGEGATLTLLPDLKMSNDLKFVSPVLTMRQISEPEPRCFTTGNCWSKRCTSPNKAVSSTSATANPVIGLLVCGRINNAVRIKNAAPSRNKKPGVSTPKSAYPRFPLFCIRNTASYRSTEIYKVLPGI